MRRFERPAVIPPSLREGGPGGRRRQSHLEQYARDSTKPAKFPPEWLRADVRGALLAMQGWVCAYCGADTSECGSDVDHFRPKSVHWWLAYDFSNYVLACSPCNQRVKKERFPLRDGHPVPFEEARKVHDEARILFDPTVDDVESHFEVDWVARKGCVYPHPSLPPNAQERAAEVIRFFRLDRKAPQIRKRLEIILEADRRVRNNDSCVSELAVRYNRHSLAARQMLAALAPGALPTPDQELTWLIDRLTADFIRKLEHLGANPTELDKREANELLWALAVLWKSPPAGSTVNVEAALEDRGLAETVRELLADL